MKYKSMTNTKYFVLLLILVIFLFSIGCQKKETASKVIISQWGHEKYLIYLPLYLAQEKMFFKEEGVDISIRFSGNDDQVFAAVLQGSAHFGIGDPVFTAIANERGGDLGKVVAVIVNGVAIWGVTNRDDIPTIKNYENLAGLKVGTFPSPSTNYALIAKTIKRGGEILSNTKIVEAPIGGQISLLERNLADIAMVLEPAASKAEEEGYRVVFSSPEFYGQFAFTGLTVSSKFLKENKEIVQKVVNAIQRALEFAHTNSEEVIEISSNIFPSLSKDVVKNAVNRMLNEKTLPASVLIEDQAWNAALKVRLEIGDLKHMQSPEISVENSFAIEAAQK